MKKSFLIAMLASNLVHATSQNLPESFLTAKPKIQLYQAYAEFKMANYNLAHAMWINLDQNGNGEAAFNLGILYEQGLGVIKDPVKAISFYKRGASRGSRSSAYQVGLLSLDYPDLITEQEALHWLSVAAIDGDSDAAALIEQISGNNPVNSDGHTLIEIRRLLSRGESSAALKHLIKITERTSPDPAAVTLLAWLYETGLGVEQNIYRAASLFLRAANEGNAEAQYAIAIMYQTGRGVEKDTALALGWMKRAAAQNYQQAIDKLNPDQ